MADPVELNPYSWDFHEDPFPVYRRLRDEAPVYRNDELGFWALTRHADVLDAFRQPLLFSNARGVALEAMSDDAHHIMSMLGMDPPQHDKIRALVSKVFTPRRVRDLEPSIRARSIELIDAFVERGEAEFIDEFAGVLPMDVISEIIGVPREDRAEIRRLADLVVHREEGRPDVPPEGAAASGAMLEYFRKDVSARRAKGGQDSLVDGLLHAEVDGEKLTDGQIVAFLFLMSVAGNETTTKLLGNALVCLQRHPGERERVERDPGEIANWVEETLRYEASSQILYRSMGEDHELRGKLLKKGDPVALVVGSANRDERVFDDADRFDLSRSFKQSLAFGQGTHFCLGASLARLEGRVALEEVQRRLKDWRVDEAGLVRMHSGNVRGYGHVPISFTAA
jgi:cytochrome P450